MAETETQEKVVKIFANDINDELKGRIKEEAAKRIDEILLQQSFTTNDISALCGISHGSVKSRAKSIDSAAGIITAVLDGKRTGGKQKAVNQASVKAMLESMTAEERAKFLNECGIVV